MAVVGLDWNINSVTLNAANNYQAVAPLTVYFDSNYAGQFTVVVSSGSLTPITLTLTGNGTDTYVADFLVRAEDWFTSANSTDTSISLELASEGWTGGSGLGVSLEDAAPECTSLTFVSDWSDPTVFIQQVTSVTATATFDLKFGATIQEAEVYSLLSTGLTIRISLSQSGDVWTGTRNALTFLSWGMGDIRLEATDSRGKVCTFYHFSGNPITVYKHGVITLNIDAYRCDSNGDHDLGGGYIAVTAYATPNPAEVMPAISSVRVGILDGNGGTVVSRRWVNNGEKVILGGGTLDPTIAYSVVADANDGYSGSQKTKTFAIPPVNRIINVKDGGTGIAFGKLATEDALLDSAWDINTDGEYLVQGQPLVDTLPDASTTTRGFVSTGAQAFAGQKTFNNRIIANASSTGDGTSGSIVAQSGNPAIVSYNSALDKYIELIAGSSGNRGLYTGDGWVLYLGGDGKLHFGKPVDATNLPVASATEAGIVGTGTQTFAGEKVFSGDAYFYSNAVVAGNDTAPRLKFRPNSNNLSNDFGWIYLSTPATNGVYRTDRFYFREYSYNSTTGARLATQENYRLPAVNADRTENKTYEILTTKETATAGTITPASGWTLSSYSYLKKWGEHFVEFYVELTGGAYSTNGWNTVATFPAGFRPSTTFDFIGLDNGASTQSNLGLDCKMASSGLLRVYKSATMTPTNNIRIHGTFII